MMGSTSDKISHISSECAVGILRWSKDNQLRKQPVAKFSVVTKVNPPYNGYIMPCTTSRGGVLVKLELAVPIID
jgi:hypothetical protein